MITSPALHDNHRGTLGYVLKVFPRVSETFVINEIRALEACGERVCVFSLHEPDTTVPHRILDELRCPVFVVDRGDVPSDATIASTRKQLERRFPGDALLHARLLPRKYVSLAVRLAALVREQQVVRLHAHFASRAGHVAALTAALCGCPYSITAHAKDIYHSDVDQELLRWKIAGAACVITVTDYNQNHLRSLVADIAGAPEKIFRLYNGIDLSRFGARPSPPRPRPLIVAVGRLVEKKGFGVLIEASRRLREQALDFDCEIIGGGPEEAELRQQILTGGLEQVVRLRGVLATEQVAERLQAATVVVLPCVVGRDGNVDALPTVLLEAMASGRPVVSTRLSGLPEIVDDGRTGLLVPPGDHAALAEAVAALITDAARCQAMGRAGRQRAEELFDLDANVSRLRTMLWSAQPGAIV